jgi:hypothetical protein
MGSINGMELHTSASIDDPVKGRADAKSNFEAPPIGEKLEMLPRVESKLRLSY